MRVADMSLAEASEFLSEVGAKYNTDAEPICAMCVEDESVRRGVAVLGRRPGGVAEIIHIYSDGSPQVFTTLYGQSVRVLKALGYKMMALDTL